MTIDNGPQLTAGDSANAYFFPSGDGFSNTTTSADTYLSVPATVTATVLNSSNSVVNTLLDNVSESGGWLYPTWDGTNSGGSVVADGSYTVKIVATNDAGSSTLTYQRQVASGTPGPAHHPDRRGHPVGDGRVRLHPEYVVHRHLPDLPGTRHLPRHRHLGKWERHLAGQWRHHRLRQRRYDPQCDRRPSPIRWVTPRPGPTPTRRR